MAIKSHDFPTFTPLSSYQIQELDKIVLLSPCQMNVLYSPHKHIFIRGGYGSGKSLVLQKRFEKIIEESDENDIFYLICFDCMSEFSHQMKLFKSKYPEKFISVFNLKEHEYKSLFYKLSHILRLIKCSWKSRTVNMFIDEFNGASIDIGEVKALKEELKFFSNSHIVIATQSMEYELLDERYEPKFQYELLASETSFELFQLDYSLRCSLEITNFVNHSMDVLQVDPVFCSGQILTHRDMYGRFVDQEFGMQFLENPIDDAVKRRYTFNKVKDVGHGISSQKVQLYTSNYESSYHVYLILHHLLSGIEEKVVVCTFNKDIYNNVYKMLEHGEIQWTRYITEFIEKKSKFTILLTDYASVRGFEFQNFIFMFDLNQEYLNYRLIEIFTRATTNLHLIVNLVNNKQPKLFECWKTLECVEWRELAFNKNLNQYVLKLNNGQEISLKHSMLANIDYSIKYVWDRYPWYETTYQNDPFGNDPDKEKLSWIIIMKDDDIKLLNELVKIHAINTQQYNILLHHRKLLHLAAKYNAVESCKYLLEKYHRSHIDVNDIIDISLDDKNVTNCCPYKKLLDMKDRNQYTPLHYAVERNNETIVNILVDHGADVNITGRWGKKPLYYAVENRKEIIVNILLDHGADVNITDNDGKTPLHYAVENNNETIVNILIDHGADVTITEHFSKTPLHCALEIDNKTIVNILLDHGADVNITDKSDKTL